MPSFAGLLTKTFRILDSRHPFLGFGERHHKKAILGLWIKKANVMITEQTVSVSAVLKRIDWQVASMFDQLRRSSADVTSACVRWLVDSEGRSEFSLLKFCLFWSQVTAGIVTEIMIADLPIIISAHSKTYNALFSVPGMQSVAIHQFQTPNRIFSAHSNAVDLWMMSLLKHSHLNSS